MAKIKIKRWARPKLTREGILSVFGPGSEGIVCRAEACPNPGCGCRDVIMHTFPIDSRVQSVEVHGGKLKVYSEAVEGAGPRSDTEGVVIARLDVDTGDLALEDGSPADFEAMPRLYWLSEALDGELLEDLARFREAMKGIGPSDDSPKLDEVILETWTPGDKVFYSEVFSPVRRDLYRVEDEIYYAMDQYCVNPGCACNEVTVIFGMLGEDLSHDPGTAHVRLTSGKVTFDPDSRDPELTARLWGLLLKRHRGLDHLAARQMKMRAIGSRLEAMWEARSGIGELSSRSDKAIGRNDPCPCGSGKKYKRCCYLKKQ